MCIGCWYGEKYEEDLIVGETILKFALNNLIFYVKKILN
jgi:hypothetical protein